MSGKKKKKKRPRNRNKSQQQGASSESSENIFPPDGMTWMEGDGLHALVPGKRPSEEQIQKITENYQREIRKSPLFKQWVKQYGKHKATQMLQECRYEVR